MYNLLAVEFAHSVLKCKNIKGEYSGQPKRGEHSRVCCRGEHSKVIVSKDLSVIKCGTVISVKLYLMMIVK